MSKLVEGGKPEQMIARHIRRWELQQIRAPREPGAPETIRRRTITLSRQCGSGGDALARELAERLGWHLFDRELVEYIAAQAHARERVIASLDEHVRSRMEEWIRSLLDRNYLSPHAYLQHLMSAVLTVAHHGEAILVGRGCHLIVHPSTSLRVRVIGSCQRRLDNLRSQARLDEKSARILLQQDDAERAAFVQTHFHHNIDDPADYDLVLNLDALDKNAAAETVLGALRA